MKMKTVEYEDLSKESLAIRKELLKNVLPIESRKRYQTYNIASFKSESKSGKLFYFCYLLELFM